MQSKLIPKKIDEEKELVFPLLMQSNKTGNVYHIVGRSINSAQFVGTLLHSENGDICEYSKDWDSTLVPYDGSITLSN